jgi:hypothetical protein
MVPSSRRRPMAIRERRWRSKRCRPRTRRRRAAFVTCGTRSTRRTASSVA